MLELAFFPCALSCPSLTSVQDWQAHAMQYVLKLNCTISRLQRGTLTVDSLCKKRRVCSNVHSLSPSFAFPFLLLLAGYNTQPNHFSCLPWNHLQKSSEFLLIANYRYGNGAMKTLTSKLWSCHWSRKQTGLYCSTFPLQNEFSDKVIRQMRETALCWTRDTRNTTSTLRVESRLMVIQFLLFQFSSAVFHLKYASYYGIVATEQLQCHLHGFKHSDVHWFSNKPIYLMVRSIQYVFGKCRIGDGRIKCKGGKGPTFHLVKENKSWSIHIRKISWN